jgi:hypothetical protein
MKSMGEYAVRADREIKICGVHVEEYEFNDKFYVYINGHFCSVSYEQAIKDVAAHYLQKIGDAQNG